MKYIKLNNGITYPLVGTGTNTFGKENNSYMGVITNDSTLVEQAINLGYRLIDTAISYRNEIVVGKGVSNVKVKREDIFITTKIPGTEKYRTKLEVNQAITKSLEDLQTDYIDLLLIHHPWDNLDEMLEMWRVFEDNVESGRLKSIGLSNFNKEQTTYILKNAKIKPVINQIESHPGFWQHELIDFLQKQDIVVEAWGPISRVTEEMISVLTKIGNKYNKSWAQVILNYQVNRNVIVIPKSHRLEGQKANIDIFDFELSKEDQETIAKL